MTDGTLDQYFTTNNRIERDIQKKPGEYRGYWCWAFGMCVGEPVVQGR